MAADFASRGGRPEMGADSSEDSVKAESVREVSASRSVSQVARGKHIWTIENFRLRSHQTSILSDIFTIKGYKFQLKVYPRQTEHVTNQEDGEEHFAVFLWCMGPNYPKEGVEVHFEIVNQIDSSASISEFRFPRPHVFTRNNPSKGYWQICSSAYVLSPGRGFVGEDGTLIISVDIEFLYRCEDNSALSAIKFEETESSIAKDMSKILQSGLLSDVEIRGTSSNGDKYTRTAHKLVLCARSCVFQAMFRQEMKENLENYVEFDDVDEEVLDAMLNYMYSDKEPDEQIAIRLLALADRYQMTSLSQLCQRVLIKALTVKNAAEIVFLSDMYQNCEELKSHAIDFIIQYLDDILRTEPWEKLMQNKPKLVNRIFQQSRSSSVRYESATAAKKMRYDRDIA